MTEKIPAIGSVSGLMALPYHNKFEGQWDTIVLHWVRAPDLPHSGTIRRKMVGIRMR